MRTMIRTATQVNTQTSNDEAGYQKELDDTEYELAFTKVTNTQNVDSNDGQANEGEIEGNMVVAIIPESDDNLGGRDIDGDRHGLGVEIIPSKGKSECGIDPSCGEVGEGAGDGGKGGHFTNRSKSGVGDRTDEQVGDKSAQWTCTLNGVTRSKEETGTNRPSNSDPIDNRLTTLNR